MINIKDFSIWWSGMFWWVMKKKNVRLDKKKKLTGIFTVERLCIFEDIVV